ncbi:MAG: hypothetical protein R3E88_15715 [Myxococcota bacterium]
MSHVTRYSVMPIPPVEAHTTWFDAGAVRVGVEYRLLTDAIAAAATLDAASGDERGQTEALDDCGVSLHVVATQDGEERELLRFDCFREDPHYHYVSWRERANDMIHLDPVADGDPLAWALERLRTRLAPMLARAGAPEVAAALDARALDAALPRIAECAYRARFAERDARAFEAEALARAGGAR